ncbi:MAG TPA: hypothetical protein VIX35_03060 [Vicinamibacterales bacterium]
MKVILLAARTTAAVFVLASLVLVATNALSATNTAPNPHIVLPTPTPIKGYKLTCAGYGVKQVIIINAGDGPVPAGTKVQWQLPKSVKLIVASDVTFPYETGTYTFQQALNPQGQIWLNVPPPSEAGGNVPIIAVPLVALFLRQCTVNLWTPTVQRPIQR